MAVLFHILQNKENPGDILIFVTCWHDMQCLFDGIKRHEKFDSKNFQVHSININTTAGRLRDAYETTNMCKILLTTSITSTLISSNSISYVIDFGLKPSQFILPSSGINIMSLERISVEEVISRNFRSSYSVFPGTVFHLFSKSVLDTLNPNREAGFTQLSLQTAILQLKVLCGDADIKLLLNTLPSAVNISAIDFAISKLISFGCLHPNGNITKLGEMLTKIPIEIRLGKFLVLSAFYGCLEPALTIAACIALCFERHTTEMYKANTEFSDDLITLLNDYNIAQAQSKNLFRGTRLRAIEIYRKSLAKSCDNLGIIGIDRVQNTVPTHTTNNQLTIVIIETAFTAAFYPNVARYVRLPTPKVETFTPLQTHMSEAVEAHFLSRVGQISAPNSIIAFAEASYTRSLNPKLRRVFLSQCCFVGSLNLILTCGNNITMSSNHDSNVILTIDNISWLSFSLDQQLAMLILEIRSTLQRQFLEFVHNPFRGFSPQLKDFLRLVIALLNNNPR